MVVVVGMEATGVILAAVISRHWSVFFLALPFVSSGGPEVHLHLQLLWEGL